MSKKSGFTEAELIAASWRKEMKKLEDNKNTSNSSSNYRKNETREVIKSNDRDRRRRSSSRNRLRSPSNNNNINTYTKSYNRYYPEKTENIFDQVDEFGRDIIPGMTKKRSHNRSRSNSPRYELNSNSHSNSWRHDKYIEIDERFDQSDVEKYKKRSLMTKDYRPPSPTWISKAGGVAIMKKK